MHHAGDIHADAKRDAVAVTRAVLAQDWTAVDLIARHTECTTCLLEALSWLVFTFIADEDDFEPCEHGSIIFRPAAMKAIDGVFADLQADLAAE